jgi:hypothetical protein
MNVWEKFIMQWNSSWRMSKNKKNPFSSHDYFKRRCREHDKFSLKDKKISFSSVSWKSFFFTQIKWVRLLSMMMMRWGVWMKEKYSNFLSSKKVFHVNGIGKESFIQENILCSAACLLKTLILSWNLLRISFQIFPEPSTKCKPYESTSIYLNYYSTSFKLPFIYFRIHTHCVCMLVNVNHKCRVEERYERNPSSWAIASLSPFTTKNINNNNNKVKILLQQIFHFFKAWKFFLYTSLSLSFPRLSTKVSNCHFHKKKYIKPFFLRLTFHAVFSHSVIHMQY